MARRALRLAFYGDDFTGSTDAMEVLAMAGIETVLLLGGPDSDVLARFPEAEAIGIAGISRSKPPAWMDQELPAIFTHLRELGAPVIHYKTCSTFDSAPHVGSIGRAIDLAQALFRNPWVPLVVGAPNLKRYSLFGNLFATSDGVTYRLDRHPTMSRHPVTPMAEADLRRHLAQQTGKSIALVDILALKGSDPDRALASVLAGRPDIVLFDVLDDDSLTTVGRLILGHMNPPQFIAGSSGVEYALVAHWKAARALGPAPMRQRPGPVDRLLVISGSCSPVTAAQIGAARAAGFTVERVDACRLLDPGSAAAEEARAVASASGALRQGRSVVLYTAEGPEDAAIVETRELAARGPEGIERVNAVIGSVLGRIARDVIHESGVRRLVVAGGDTSGPIAQALGLAAVSVLAPTTPGSPLCRALSKDAALDGLEVAFKGGQIGGPDYFVELRDGAVHAGARARVKSAGGKR